MSQDQIYARPLGQISGFEFDHRVVEVFPDMIQRSVPGYESIIAMTGMLASGCVKPGSQCYDLGCSLGASTLSIHMNVPDDCKIIAVDSSSAMIEKFSARLKDTEGKSNIQLVTGDVREQDIQNASLVVMNFTLQFIPVEYRLSLIRKIYEGMNPGGLLLVSEKIELKDPEMNGLFIQAHHEFKRRQGYSDLEISQKRTALEEVLIPETIEQHQERFQQAGFRQSSLWFQCLNFCSIVAAK